MLRKQPYALLAILSALSLVPACAGLRRQRLRDGSGGNGHRGGTAPGTAATAPAATAPAATAPAGQRHRRHRSAACHAAACLGPRRCSRSRRTAARSRSAARRCGACRASSTTTWSTTSASIRTTPSPPRQFVTEQKIDTGKAGNFNTNAYAHDLRDAHQPAVPGGGRGAGLGDGRDTSALAAILPSPAAGPRTRPARQQFISSFANRAFRGQLDADETAALNTLYTTVSAQFDFPTGIQAVIEAVLTSPRFLFVLEFGQPGASRRPPFRSRRWSWPRGWRSTSGARSPTRR